MEAWTHYNEWGLITHNAVLKCGQRELDLVKRYATHDYDSVLELYYAKARFYDAHDRRFTAVDPILDPSGYDLREYVQNPAQLVQYLYVVDNPVIYIDPLGEIAAETIVTYVGVAFSTYLVTWFNSPSGREAIDNASKFIADGIAYMGNGILTFADGVTSGIISSIGSLTIETPSRFQPKELYVGALNATGIGEQTGYMVKVACEGKNDSNSQSGKSDSESNSSQGKSNSEPNRHRKLPSYQNPIDPKWNGRGNSRLPKREEPSSSNSSDLNKNNGGNSGPPQVKQPAATQRIKFPEKNDIVKHIFRKAKGHLAEDTPANRALLEDVANDPTCRLGTDMNGNVWYARLQADGSQIWVRVRGTEITDGGVNTVPRPWDSITGLCKPQKP